MVMGSGILGKGKEKGGQVDKWASGQVG